MKNTLIFLFFLFSLNVNSQTLKSDEIHSDYQAVHNHLYNELIPFWEKNAVDKTFGGFMTNFDANGVALDMPEKYLNTQCRMIWWFSQLNSVAPVEGCLPLRKVNDGM